MDREYVLPPMGVLRISTSFSPESAAFLTLQSADSSASASADICGAALLPGTAVRLPAGRMIAVHTLTGCTLRLSADSHVSACVDVCAAAFVQSLADINAHLETRRVAALRGGIDAIGPRVLVVSDRPQVGVSTYVCALANDAVRFGYHPLLLDLNCSSPRFGFPGAAALFALQHAICALDETLFFPALHAHAGAGRDDDALRFLQSARRLAHAATERAARSDRCRVGGMFVDFGAVSPARVADAEAAATSGEERRKTNPIDALIDTVTELGIDHVLVVKSAWLRFKIAQRMHSRFAAADAAPMTFTPNAAICPDGLRVGLFLVDAVSGNDCVDAAHARRQRWLQYFFGTRTSPVRPVLLTVDTDSLRIVQMGRSDAGSMATFMPMDDEEHAENTTGTGYGAASVSYVLPQDVDLKDRIVAVSAATEQEELSDGTLQRVPFATFESRLKTGLLMGFALVESVSMGKITLLTNGAFIRKDCGLCLILTEDRLETKSAQNVQKDV